MKRFFRLIMFAICAFMLFAFGKDVHADNSKVKVTFVAGADGSRGFIRDSEFENTSEVLVTSGQQYDFDKVTAIWCDELRHSSNPDYDFDEICDQKAFVSWNTQADGNGQTYNGKKVVTSDITLYAQYTTDVYKITFYSTSTSSGFQHCFIYNDNTYYCNRMCVKKGGSFKLLPRNYYSDPECTKLVVSAEDWDPTNPNKITPTSDITLYHKRDSDNQENENNKDNKDNKDNKTQNATASVGTEIDGSTIGVEGKFVVTSSTEGAATVKYVGPTNSKKKKVRIPDKIKDANGVEYTVTEIGAKAFYKNKKVKKVVFPSTIKKIYKKAFKDCVKLATITINGNELESIESGAFKNIKDDAKITIKCKNKKIFNKIVKKLKKAGAKNAIFIFKKR